MSNLVNFRNYNQIKQSYRPSLSPPIVFDSSVMAKQSLFTLPELNQQSSALIGGSSTDFIEPKMKNISPVSYKKLTIKNRKQPGRFAISLDF